MATKITDPKKMRKNLAYERAYELRNKEKRNASKRVKTPIRQKARATLEKKIGRKLKKTETVGHKTPIARGGSNSPRNLKVQSPKSNYAEGGRMSKTRKKSTSKK